MKIRMKNYFRFLTNFLLHKPYSAQIEVTLRCNGKCPFCSIHSLPSSYTKNEMSTTKIKNIIDQIAEFGINTLSFTGGEPTLRKDLSELVYHAGVKHDLITGIATNGFLMPKLLKNGYMSGLDYILLSLDYSSPEMHDKTRALKSFDKIIETIKLAKKKDIKTIISTVAMNDNLNHLDEICKIAKNLDIPIEIYPCENIIRDFPDKSYHVNNIDQMIPDLSKWANYMRSLRLKYENILTDPVSIKVIESGGFGGNSSPHQQKMRCRVAESHIFIRYDGSLVFPCKIHPIINFDIRKKSLSEIYELKIVKKIIKKHDSFDFCDGCRLGCALNASNARSVHTLFSKYIKAVIMGQL